MDLSNLTLFKLMTRKMGWLSQRQEVLAQNIANGDTPGYRPHDLAPFSFQGVMREQRRLVPAATQPGHLAGTAEARPPRDATQKDSYETSPDGNAVVLEEQMVKVAETGMDYQLVTNLYRKHVGLIKAALSSR